MKTASEILSMSNGVTPRQEPTPKPASDASIKKLFAEMIHMVGAPEFGRQFGDAKAEDVRRTWAEQLAGFTVAEIKRGLAEVSNRRFPPRLGEFKVWCRPALDPELAWYEAEAGLRARADGNRGEWTHAAIWRAASTMSMEVASGDFARNRGRWSALLKRELAQGHGDIPEPVQRIAYTEGKPAPVPEATLSLKRLLHEEKAHRAARAAAKAEGNANE